MQPQVLDVTIRGMRGKEWIRQRGRLTGTVCVVLAISGAGCVRTAQAWYIAGYDRDIRRGTREIETARDDSARAAGYARRGLAYSEKARYCRFAKLVSADEYERMFGQAVQDGNRATGLAPASAEVWFSLGQTYFSRIGPEHTADSDTWLAMAAADFTRAVERDPGHSPAWDMLGMVRQAGGDLDQAIEAYTREAALNSLGRSRLAEAYCERGGVRHKDRNSEASIADYRKSIELGASQDSCDCDPYNPLANAYYVARDYDSAWQIVSQARRQRRWIMPELLEALKRDSGRDH